MDTPKVEGQKKARIRQVRHSFNAQREQLFPTDVGLKKIAPLGRPHTAGCSCEDEITHFQREVGGDVRNEVIKAKDHVSRIALLHHFTILSQGEVDGLWLAKLCQRYEVLAQWGREVKGLCLFPGEALFLAALLGVPCGKIDANTDGVVVLVCKLGEYVFANPLDAKYKLYFVM